MGIVQCSLSLITCHLWDARYGGVGSALLSMLQKGDWTLRGRATYYVTYAVDGWSVLGLDLVLGEPQNPWASLVPLSI